MIERTTAFGGDASEQARLGVPVGLPGGPVLTHPRAAEDHQCRTHAGIAQNLVCLGEFQQEAHAAHGFAQQEILVESGQPVGGRLHLWRCFFVVHSRSISVTIQPGNHPREFC